jgi:uncharacterized protein YbjQ (UPF0145 family)
MNKNTKEMLKVLAGSLAISAIILYFIDRITPASILISGIALLVSFTGGMLSLRTRSRKKRSEKEVKKILVRTDSVLEKEVEKLRCLGTVYGESIIAADMVNDLFSNTRILFGGEPKGYRQIMSVARRKAVERMIREAGKKGAFMVTGHRLTTTQVSDRSAEVISYGTAWKMTPTA